jgi:hypothetical protein
MTEAQRAQQLPLCRHFITGTLLIAAKLMHDTAALAVTLHSGTFAATTVPAKTFPANHQFLHKPVLLLHSTEAIFLENQQTYAKPLHYP